MAGCRARVVNGKRTDLTELVLSKFQRELERQRGFTGEIDLRAPQLFQGHTRFATSSICDLGGCHPHQAPQSPTHATRGSFLSFSYALPRRPSAVGPFPHGECPRTNPYH